MTSLGAVTLPEQTLSVSHSVREISRAREVLIKLQFSSLPGRGGGWMLRNGSDSRPIHLLEFLLKPCYLGGFFFFPPPFFSGQV